MFACNAGAPLRRNGDGAIAALAAVFVLGSAAAATGLSSSPTELATNSIGCYDAAGNVVCRRMPSCAGRDGSAGIRRCWAVGPCGTVSALDGGGHRSVPLRGGPAQRGPQPHRRQRDLPLHPAAGRGRVHGRRGVGIVVELQSMARR
jgi:hypothetical protein